MVILKITGSESLPKKKKKSFSKYEPVSDPEEARNRVSPRNHLAPFSGFGQIRYPISRGVLDLDGFWQEVVLR